MDFKRLSRRAITGETLLAEECQTILESPEIALPALIQAAFEVRQKFCGREVMLHIINNAQNGHCPEDCHYCAQAKSSDAAINEYALKSDEEILAEAQQAYKNGAYRYCMVFAGRGPSQRRTEHLARLIRTIKDRYPLKICVSAGLLDDEKARILKEAGLDRLNHNLNTSEEHYPKICTTHTFADRLNTLKAARQAGIELCSGIIIGMGETKNDIIDVAFRLRDMEIQSIPVNFFIPIKGTALKGTPELTPEYCLRVLCLFRFLNPRAEIRVAAGREIHLRSMEVLALYPANSLFLQGYLNARGSSNRRTLQMIKDAGFTIKSDIPLEILLHEESSSEPASQDPEGIILKDLSELRPYRSPATTSSPKSCTSSG